MAVIILILGLIISTIDNLLMPFILSSKVSMGPIITLVSIIGGISLFGLYGIILGPFFVGFLFVLIQEIIYEVSSEVPGVKKYVWTAEEREQYRNLKTPVAKEEFSRMLHERYAQEEHSKGGEKVYKYYQ